MSFEPLVLKTLLALTAFALTAMTPPRAMLSALRDQPAPILLSACGQILLAPLILFYYLPFTGDPPSSLAMISLIAVPALGPALYFVHVAGGSVPVAMWSTFISVGVSGVLAPSLVHMWLIAAPEAEAAAAKIYVDAAVIFESMLYLHTFPAVAGLACRLSAPAFSARFFPKLGCVLVALAVVYPIMTLPITSAYSASAVDRHLDIVVLFAVICSASAMYVMSLSCDRAAKGAMLIILPCKLSIIPIGAPILIAASVELDKSLFMTWTAVQFVYCVTTAAYLRIRGYQRLQESAASSAESAQAR